MGKVKVYAPNEGYAGTVGDIKFDKGVAEVDEAHASMPYFRRRGYGIGEKGKTDNPVLPYDKMEPTVDGKPVDARDFDEEVPFGSKLRDAAVKPEPTDFLPPTNAGDANPHGPKVVAPGLHAVGPAGIKPGNVHVDDTDEQQKDETALATKALIEGQPADERDVAFDGDPKGGNMGPLGLSDPGSADQGVEAAKDVREAEAASDRHGTAKSEPTAPKGPKGSRSKTKSK